MTPHNFYLVPQELKDIPNWVLWRLEERNGKNTKIPYQTSGKKADTTNPDTWNKFDYVEQALIRREGKFSGLGFVFSEDMGIIGIDWDKVRDLETGEWDEEILEEIKILNSYAELSQSGTGAHVLIKGKIPGDRRRKGNIEMYSNERFFVVTGQHLEGTPSEITENQEAIDKLYEKRFKADKKGEKKSLDSAKEIENKLRCPKMTDDEVLDHCRKAVNSEKFIELYDKGEWKTFNYPSQSEADFALCSIMAFYTQDEKQLDRLFRKGALYREDWDRTSKYTLKNVLNQITEVYSPGKREKKRLSKGKPEKIIVNFDEVGDQVLKENYIFSMRDNRQIYLYQKGVYRSEGTEAILGTLIRDVYNSMYKDRWQEINSDFDLPEHLPKATKRYVDEVLAYICSYTHITRDSIEADQAKYINFKNCLFNLETWETEDHNPQIKSIVQIPVNFNPEAKCPQINRFLGSVVAELDINLLCEIAGYCLTTDCSFQKAFLLYGGGSNGKSVCLALLESLVGGENTSAESLQRLEFDKYRTAKLYGKRVNICGDIPDSKMHKSEVFKKLTSGLDLIDGENKYKDPFKFKNTAKLVFSANVLPEGKKDKAYYRRWILINFPNNFEGANDDKSLISKLRDPEELSGFLNLALNGLKRLRENGEFSNSKSVSDTQKEYEFNSNPIAAFMDECTKSSTDDLDATILYSTYTLWAKVNNKRIIVYSQWSKELKSLGYENYRDNTPGSNCTKKIAYWCNLKINPQAQDRLNWKIDKEACPDYIVFSDCEKTNIGQVGQASSLPQICFENKPYCRSCIYYTKGEKRNSLTNSPEACPKMRFFDNDGHRTGLLQSLSCEPVLVQKSIISEQSEDFYNINRLQTISLLRTDLINFVSSQYHSVVDNVQEMIEKFLAEYPGYKQKLGYQTVLDVANKLNEWGWN